MVTGAASGIGRGFVLRLSESGYRVHALDIDAAGLESLADAVSDRDLLATQVGDVRTPPTWDRVKRELQEHDVALAVLAAGRLLAGKLDRCSPGQIEQLVGVNLTGVLLGAQALTPLLIDSATDGGPTPLPRGLLSVASIFATVAPPGFAAYSATKAGVIAATEALRGELAPHGLTATAVAPGIVPTGLFGAADYSDAEIESAVRHRVEEAELSIESVVTASLKAYRRRRLVAPIGRRAGRYYWLKRWLPGVTQRVIASRAEKELNDPGR